MCSRTLRVETTICRSEMYKKKTQGVTSAMNNCQRWQTSDLHLLCSVSTYSLKPLWIRTIFGWSDKCYSHSRHARKTMLVYRGGYDGSLWVPHKSDILLVDRCPWIQLWCVKRQNGDIHQTAGWLIENIKLDEENEMESWCSRHQNSACAMPIVWQLLICHLVRFSDLLYAELTTTTTTTSTTQRQTLQPTTVGLQTMSPSDNGRRSMLN